MSLNGTTHYSEIDRRQLPELVCRAVDAAIELDFELSVHPATGRLLQVLAHGVPMNGLIGETGTGTGVGLAWMVSLADPSVSFLSVEIDVDRARVATEVFRDDANVTVLHADAGELFTRGPFDLLVHDGGWGSGKTSEGRVDVTEVLKEGGVMTVDDFTPMDTWPPTFNGEVDHPRLHWLQHPDLLTTEVRVTEHLAVVVSRRTTTTA